MPARLEDHRPSSSEADGSGARSSSAARGCGTNLPRGAPATRSASGWGSSAVSENLSLTGQAGRGIRVHRGSDASRLPSGTSGRRSRTSPTACATGTFSARNPEGSYPGPLGTRQPSAISHRACPYLGLRPDRAPGSPGILTVSERTVVARCLDRGSAPGHRHDRAYCGAVSAWARPTRAS